MKFVHVFCLHASPSHPLKVFKVRESKTSSNTSSDLCEEKGFLYHLKMAVNEQIDEQSIGSVLEYSNLLNFPIHQ